MRALDKPKVAAYRWIHTHRSTWLARRLARVSQNILNAYENLTHDGDRNGERRALDVLAAGPMRNASPALFDAGAHVGDWTAAALNAFPNSRVHAFEPSPATFARLRARFINDPRVTTNNVALTSADAPVHFHVDEDDPQGDSMFEHPSRVNARPIVVEARRGDGYAVDQGIDRVDFLKIDTEGNDLEVLQGFRPLVETQAVTVIQFEYTSWNAVTRVLLRDFYDMLGAAGYVIGKVRPDGVEFKEYELREDNFRGPSCIAVAGEREDLISTLRGSY